MTGHCFARSSVAALPFRVFINAPPPANDNVTSATYPHWPATDFSSSQASLCTSTYSEPGHTRSVFVWANRKNQGPDGYNYKPNPLPGRTVLVDGKECRSTFTTAALANAATRIQVRHLLGLPYDMILADRPGLRAVIPYAEWQADPSIFDQDRENTQYGVTTTYRVREDTVFLYPHAGPFDGFEIDYEPQDGRTEAVTISFLHALRGDIRQGNKGAFLLVNAYNQSGAIKSAVTEAALASFLEPDGWDHLTLWLHSDNAAGSVAEAYNTQAAMLPPDVDWSRIVLRFELGGDPDAADPGTTLADAAWVHQRMLTAPRPGGLQFHRSGAQAGGACDTYVNQKISAACYGGTP